MRNLVSKIMAWREEVGDSGLSEFEVSYRLYPHRYVTVVSRTELLLASIEPRKIAVPRP